jgi:phospholipid/cholesterol/gamma-HCH transport system substrate-binding protein
MARQTLPWAELKTGALVLTALAIVGVAILSVGQKGRVFSDTITLVTRFPRVLGLKTSAPVWLEGVDVGSVKEIKFVQVPDSPVPVIDVKLTVGREYQHLIRTDSVASIEGKGLLGDKIVHISVGSNAAPEVPDGGRLLSESPADFAALLDEGAGTVRNLNAITTDLRVLTGNIGEGRGSLGKFVKDENLYDNLERTTRNLAELTAKLGKNDGSLVKLLNDPKLYDEVTALVHEIRKGDGTLAKLIQDPNLYEDARGTIANARSVVKRVDDVVAKTEKGDGNVGKMVSDEELYRNLNAAVAELRELVADIKKNPKKYINVSVF